MKITGATSLRELQQLVSKCKLNIHVNFVGSAGAYAATVVGPSKLNPEEPTSVRAIGSSLGEAVASAIAKYEEKTR